MEHETFDSVTGTVGDSTKTGTLAPWSHVLPQRARTAAPRRAAKKARRSVPKRMARRAPRAGTATHKPRAGMRKRR
jgi:hypothetical protein